MGNYHRLRHITLVWPKKIEDVYGFLKAAGFPFRGNGPFSSKGGYAIRDIFRLLHPSEQKQMPWSDLAEGLNTTDSGLRVSVEPDITATLANGESRFLSCSVTLSLFAAEESVDASIDGNYCEALFKPLLFFGTPPVVQLSAADESGNQMPFSQKCLEAILESLATELPLKLGELNKFTSLSDLLPELRQILEASKNELEESDLAPTRILCQKENFLVTIQPWE